MANKKQEKEYLERKERVNKFFESPKLKDIRRGITDDEYFNALFMKNKYVLGFYEIIQ